MLTFQIVKFHTRRSPTFVTGIFLTLRTYQTASFTVSRWIALIPRTVMEQQERKSNEIEFQMQENVGIFWERYCQHTTCFMCEVSESHVFGYEKIMLKNELVRSFLFIYEKSYVCHMHVFTFCNFFAVNS